MHADGDGAREAKVGDSEGAAGVVEENKGYFC